MTEESLGTLEFCSILNGDDADAAYQYLKRFVKICRKERLEAFLGADETIIDTNEEESDEDFDGDGDDEEENLDSESRPTKKNKVDAWKKDTKGYNVPFVGTSFHKGSTGKVVKGTWPTGFLEAYLDKSPKANEIIGNDAFLPPNGSFHRNLLRRKDKVGKRKSMKLHNIYIQTVGEIATSSIPIRKLRHFSSPDMESDSDRLDQKLASIIVKDLLQHLLTILNNESSSGASQPILESVLTTLKYLASCSVGIAREIAGEMDVKVKDGVLQKLAFYGTRTKEVLSKSDQNGTINHASNENAMKKMITSFKVQNAYLDFASVMLSYNDATILSYVTNPGGRENKSKPGIAYLALRSALSYMKKLMDEVLVSDSILNAGYESLGGLFAAVRLHLLDANSSENNGIQRLSLSNNALLEFFHDGSLEKIIQISALAGLRDDNSVLKVECDNILRIVFSDHMKSPFLIYVKADRLPGKNRSTKVSTHLDKAIQTFLSVNGDMKSRHFMVKCFNQTPSLFQSWMKNLLIPDPKPSFSFLSKISMLYLMLENGPITNEGPSMDNQSSVNSILASIIPKSLSKNILTKALQSQNAILVSEVLKLIMVILLRYKRVVKHYEIDEDETKVLVQKISGKLPDLQILLALRSRFDPFCKILEVNSVRNQLSSNEVIMIHLCEAIERYSIFYPAIVRDVQYDWIKFLNDFSSFLQVPRCVQFRILKLLSCVFHCSGSSHSNTMTGSKFVRSLLNIMLRTENRAIYDLSRDLAEKVVTYAIFSGMDDANHAQKKNHEINIWIDAIQKDTVDSFCRIFETAQKIHIQLETIKQSAKKYLVGHGPEVEITISPLIAISLLALSNEDTLNPEIVNYLCKIIAKLLLTSSNAVSLAVAIEYIFRDSKRRNVANAELKSLLLYSQSIVKRNSIAESTSLCRLIFGDNHFHTIVDEMANNDQKYLKSKLVSLNRLVSDAPLVSIDVCRQCESLIQHSTSKTVKDQLYDILTDNLPFSFQEMSDDLIWDENRKSLESFMRHLSFLISSCAHIKLSGQIYRVNEFADIEYIIYTLLKNDQSIITRKLNLVQACIVQFVPISVRSFWIESLIAIRQNGARDLQILATGMLCKSLNLYKEDELSQLTIEKVCKLWSELLLQTQNDHLIPVESKLLRALEEILCGSMIIPSVHLSILNTIVDLTPRRFTENINYDLDGIAIHIIQSDVTIIGESIVMDLLKDLNFSSSIPTRFALASNIVHEIAIQRQTFMQSFDWYFQLLKFIVYGLTKIENLLEKGDNSDNHIAISMMDAIGTAWGTITKQQQLEIRDSVLQSIITLLQNSMAIKRRAVNKPVQTAFISLLLHIFTHDSSADEKQGMEQLRAMTMRYIIKMLPRLAKENELVLLRDMELLIMTLIDYYPTSLDQWDKLLAISLKLGISDIFDNQSSLFIKIARKIVSASVGNKKSDDLHIFSSAQVHDMILSHSKFRNVMESDSSTRKELIALMVCCVSLSNGPIEVPENEKVDLLLLKYRGSVSSADRLLRYLLQLYDRRQEIKPFIHSLKWGPNQTTNFPTDNSDLLGTDHAQHFEWFMDCLDIHRVRKTISDFPVHDTLEPSPLLLSDIRKSTRSDELVTTKSSSMNAQYSDSSSSYTSSGEDEDDFSVMDKDPELDIHWEAPDGDDRYSPGAIIPYILAILETFEDFKSDIEPDLEPEHDADENPMDENKLKRQTFARVVCRLFQKGAAALVLSCLGSKCASIRKVAVAILGKFLTALKLEESRSISGWKSKSQMEMALDAIQRGLMVARARKLQDNTSSNENIHIPMLPNVSALFLSRALLTLNKPGDDMYPAINKYFLRLDDHHGAYSDCFSLPIFMALFCSVNESDEIIAKKERCFALQLLKDGTTDDLCYKVASKRHVPELLLTALSSFLSKNDPGDDSECFLILGAIEKLVINGGDIAYRHYFKSVGLVPWFQTTIQSCVSNVDFQSASLLNAMIRLFRIILAKYQSFLEKEEDGDIFLVTLDSSGILLLLSNFHQLQLSSKIIASPRKLLSTSEEIVKIICSIHDIELISQKGQSQSYPFPIVRPSGFQVQMALELLESDEVDVEYGSCYKLITVFCKYSMKADLSNEKERCAVVMLCIALIKSISKLDKNRMDRLDVSILVLRRISSLYPMISTKNTCYLDLLDHVLSFRKHAIKHRSLRKVWMECLRVMVNSSNDNSGKYPQLLLLLERLEDDSISKATLN